MAQADRPAAPSLLGRVLDDRYEVVRKLGEGAMGVVYEVRHLRLDKRFAMKVIHGQLAQVPEFTARFEREALACSRMDHPNTISVTDFGRAATGELFLVMEFVEGHSIEELVQAEPLALEQALETTRQVLLALQHAHAAGVIHRDIKPENIMRVETDDGSWWVKVLDFGIAKAPTSGPGGQLTQAGVVFGTPQYMAPEQAMSATVDARADLYAVGATLWRMLTGRPLFDGEGPVEIISAKLSRPPPDLKDFAPGVYSPALLRFMRRALARKPSDRFPSADEMLAALTAIQSAEGGGLAAPSRWGAWLAQGRNVVHRLNQVTAVQTLQLHAGRLTRRVGTLYASWYRPEQTGQDPGWPDRLTRLVTTSPGRWVAGLSLGALLLATLLVVLPATSLVPDALESPGRPTTTTTSPAEGASSGSWVGRLLPVGKPKRPSISKETKQRLVRVRLLLEKGACHEASLDLMNLLREHTELAEAHYLLGAAEYCSRHYESALASYRKAIALDGRYRKDVRIHEHLRHLLARRRLAHLAVSFAATLGDAGIPLLARAASNNRNLEARHLAATQAVKLGAARKIDWVASLSLDLHQLETCEERCKVVERLEELGDPAAIPALRRARDATVRYHLFRKRWRNGCCRKRIIAAIKALMDK